MTPSPARRRVSRYPNWGSAFAALALTAFSVLDVAALAHLDSVPATLAPAVRQPLTALVIIALPLLPAYAFRAAERAARPRLAMVRVHAHHGAASDDHRTAFSA